MTEYEVIRTQVMNLFKSAQSTLSEFQAALSVFDDDDSYASRVCDTRDANGTTLIHIAAASGKLDIVKELCRLNKNCLDSVDKRLNTPLHSSLFRNQVNVAEWLVTRGLSLYVTNLDNKTCAQIAVEMSPRFVEKQMKNNIEWNDAYHNTTMSLAVCLHTSPDIAARFIASTPSSMLEKAISKSSEKGAVPDPVFILSASCDEKYLCIFQSYLLKLDHEFLLTSKDSSGCTVLFNAAESGFDALVDLIIDFVEISVVRRAANIICNGLNAYCAAKHGISKNRLHKLTECTDIDAIQTTIPLVPKEEVLVTRSEGVCICQESLNAATKHKDSGAAAFSTGNTEEAISQWEAAVALIFRSEVPQLTEPFEDSDVKRFVSSLFSNLSAAYLRLHKITEAVKLAELAIKFDSEWWKGYYRLAKCYKAVENYEEATQQLFESCLRNPDSKECHKEFKSCLEMAKARHAQNKK